MNYIIRNQFINSTLNNPVFNFNKQEIPKILSSSVPFPPEFFLGREADLEAVNDKLFSGDKLLLINGEGGIGKTTLAAKYWQKYEKKYCHLAWLFTGNNLHDALLTLAPRLQVSFPDTMPSEQRLSEMLTEMAGLDEPCLLVLDNANDADELRSYYKALHACTNFHILLTSRIPIFEQAATYPIRPLDEEHAISLFKKYYPRHRDKDDELLKAIRKAVGGNTLVLELLAKNLNVINDNEEIYPLAGLLQDLQQKGLFRLAHDQPISVDGKHSRHGFIETKPTAVLTTLYDEVEMVKPLNDEEKRLLSNLAVLPAENIAYTQLKALLSPEDIVVFSKTLSDLAQRGWLEKSSPSYGGTQYKISPVVQEITRHKNQPQLLEHVRTLINTLIKILLYEPGTGHFVNASYEEAAVFANYAEVLVAHVAEEVDEDLAILCEFIGSYQQTTGNLDKALTSFGQFNQLSKELYDATPQNVGFKNGLAISYQFLGNIHTVLGDLEQALYFYNEYSRIEKELYDAYPKNVDFKNGLAIAYFKLGEMHTALGDLEQALSLFKESSRLEKELYDPCKQNADFKYGLAISYSNLGNTFKALGDLEQALNFLQDSTRLIKELYDAYPEKVGFKHGLCVSLTTLGETYLALGNVDLALTYDEMANQTIKELYDAYPQNVEFKKGLAISCERLGVTLTALGDLEQALTFFEYETHLFVELFDAYPQNVAFKSGLAVSCEKIGEAYTAMGLFDQALTFFESETRLFKGLFDAYPQNLAFKHGLASAYSKLGETLTARGYLEQALGFFEEYSRLGKELYDATPQNVAFKHMLVLSYAKLGETNYLLGHFEQALTFFECVTRLFEELYDSTSQNVAFKNGLAVSYLQLGQFYRDQKSDKAMAKKNFKQCYRLWQELADAYPAYVEFKNNLAVAKNALDGL